MAEKRARRDRLEKVLILILLTFFAFSSWFIYINMRWPLSDEENAHILTLWHMEESGGDYKASFDRATREKTFEALVRMNPEENVEELRERAEQTQVSMYKNPFPFFMISTLFGAERIEYKARMVVALALLATVFLIVFHFKRFYLGVVAGIIFMTSSAAMRPWFLMEPFQCFFITLGVFLYARKRENLAIVSVGLASLFKETTFVFMAPFLLYHLFKKDVKKSMVSGATIFFFMALFMGINTFFDIVPKRTLVISELSVQALVVSLKFVFNLGNLSIIAYALILFALYKTENRFYSLLLVVPVLFFMTINAKFLGEEYGYWEYVRYVFHPLAGFLSILCGVGLAKIFKLKDETLD